MDLGGELAIGLFRFSIVLVLIRGDFPDEKGTETRSKRHVRREVAHRGDFPAEKGTETID